MMASIPPGATGAWSGAIIPRLGLVLLIGLGIALVAELITLPLARLQGSARATVSARLNRARAAAMRLGIEPGKGDIVKQFKDLNLGLIGWLRYRRVRKILLEPTPGYVLRFRSRYAYRRDMLTQFLLKCVSLLRPYGIFSLANLRILLLAGAIVVVVEHFVGTLKHTLLRLRDTLPWHSIAEWVKEWYVLVSLGIVILIVVTRSPLVDRVRARDDAAKDANRLLAQLFGKLSNVERYAGEYLNVVEESRTQLVIDAVLKATGGRFTWTHDTGLTSGYDWYSRTVRDQWSGKEADELDKACKELSDHLTEYQRHGLHTVARRLMSPVSWSLVECGLSFSDPDSSDYVRRRFVVISADVNRKIETWVKLMIEAEQRGDDRSCERWRIAIDEGARDYASYLDTRLASAYQKLLHLHHVNHFLNRRLHGTTRTRLAGSFVR